MIESSPRRILSLAGSSSGEIVALCPGAKLKSTDAISSPVQCLESVDKKFRVGNGEGAVNFEDISCSKSIKEQTSFFLKHACITLRQSANPVCGSWKNQASSLWAKQHRA